MQASEIFNVPAELRIRDQWVCWRNEGRNGSATKRPYQVNGELAKTNTQDTWAAFDTVWNAAEEFDGIGFVFANGGGFVGVDLDGCRNPETGEVAEWARDVIQRLDSYSEVSPSGSGVKIFVRGKSPFDIGKNRKLDYEGIGGKDAGIEIYDRLRYFVVTGQRLAGVSPNIEKRDLGWLKDRFWPAPKQRNGKPKSGPRIGTGNVVDRASKYVAKMPGAISGQSGHDATFAAACALVLGFELSEDDALTIMREYNERCEPQWSEHELLHKVRSAVSQPGERGYLSEKKAVGGTGANQHAQGAHNAPSAKERQKRKPADSVPANSPEQKGQTREKSLAITNYELVEKTDDEGNKKSIAVPLRMRDILSQVREHTDNGVRRVGTSLFIDDHKHGVHWLEKQPDLFGYFQSTVDKVNWRNGFVSRPELFSELRRTSDKFDSVESLPHEPPVAGCHYACTFPSPGDGSALRGLVGRFRPETPVDEDLLRAAIVTLFWGGSAGARPAFVFSSDAGRGSGKTKTAEAIARVAGGQFDISANEDIEKIKQRLLTPSASGVRVAILDNVKTTRFSWAELESLITTVSISGKQMYHGESSRPNLITWLVTLNGVSLATDLAQRCVIIKLTKGVNHPAWFEETLRYIEDRRQDIIGDCIAFLRSERYELDNYSRWASWQRDVLSRLSEPAEAQKVIAERQGEADVELDECEIIEHHFAEQLRGLGYSPDRCQVRIPVAIARDWFCDAVGDRMKTTTVSRRIKQMIGEKTLRRLSDDSSRTYGRCSVWTGENADIDEPVLNDLADKVREARQKHHRKDA